MGNVLVALPQAAKHANTVRDSPKFGGPGKLKKACIQRTCTNMQPPTCKVHESKQINQKVKSGKIYNI